MHSKTSNPPNSLSLWKAASPCSESELIDIARTLGTVLQPNDRVLLEGPMGVGKTTFTRSLLSALSVNQPPEGSPTFAIAHEYDSPLGGVVHIDFYRLKSELEIDEAGIPAYYWERQLVVISEWLSAWPKFESKVLKSGRIWKVQLDFAEGTDQRSIRIQLI